MIFKRFAANLRAQNWSAIVIELAIVVLGVFIGTLVANANEARVQRAEVRRLLTQVQPDILTLADYYPEAQAYYGAVRRYASVALNGWQGDPAVSDRDFVVAAYQASQIRFLNYNIPLWAEIMGTNLIPAIDDPDLRDQMKSFVVQDFSQYQLPNTSAYREQVRRALPIAVQDRVREGCGDRISPVDQSISLPATCNVTLDPALVQRAAAKLRARPELADDLNWHLGVLVNFLDFARGMAESSLQISARIDQVTGKTPPPEHPGLREAREEAMEAPRRKRAL